MEAKQHTVEVIEPCLEIDEALDLQEKGWKLQRFGWVFIVTIMVLGALGLFGEGILSKREIKQGNSHVEFERFFRYEVEMRMDIQSDDHIASISVPQEYLKNFRIVRFVPEPVNNTSHDKTVQFNFLPGDNHIVSLYMIAKHYGDISGSLNVNGRDDFNLTHFIYP